jgi:hypothetical protein
VFLKRLRRHRLNKKSVPLLWYDILDAHLPQFGRLSPDDRGELVRHARVLLSEKSFEDCGGMILDETTRIAIAGHASLLLLHRKHNYFSNLFSIIVYPTNRLVHEKRAMPDGTVWEGDIELAGQSGKGTCVLSMEDIRRTSYDPKSSRNTILHEFAHVLDGEDGCYDGFPKFPSHTDSIGWIVAFSKEFERLRSCVEGRDSLPSCINAYGANNPAEFFAVVVEHFFQIPVRLKSLHPMIYDQLRGYFKQDPVVDWIWNLSLVSR